MNVSNASPDLAELFMALGQRPQERTRVEIFYALGLNRGDNFLDKLRNAHRLLRECNVEIYPRLQDEPPDGTFLLRRKSFLNSRDAGVIDRLSQLESASQEFKSSYWCDIKRLSHQKTATNEQLRSEQVKHSALKSIAGFLTTGGGTLYIGVSDSGEILGLRPDLKLLNKQVRNVDQLINNIRTDITSKFRDGKTVNDYVTIYTVDIAEQQILQLEVASRSKLTFLPRPKSNPELFRRQGNRTVTVEIFEVEEFQAWRASNRYIRPSISGTL